MPYPASLVAAKQHVRVASMRHVRVASHWIRNVWELHSVGLSESQWIRVAVRRSRSE